MEGKAHRSLSAQRNMAQPAIVSEDAQEVGESGTDKDEDESLINKGMLPSNIVMSAYSP